jgi:hypothetical protein
MSAGIFRVPPFHSQPGSDSGAQHTGRGPRAKSQNLSGAA